MYEKDRTMPVPISLREKLSRIPKPWTPRIVAAMNDYHFKLAKIEGEFVWHSHPETDEVFLVVDGEMGIEFRDGTVRLREGEMVVVPAGVEHRPFADEPCGVLLVEPEGTVNTGDAGGDLTAPSDDWV